ncbi:MAG: NAD-dependent epimerase/dehydratase family protein, partial [Actinomycetota bacterium]|nr:NAD-dependent epimerase/dehydratase family protein [Actinomycetota bacterium]
MRVLVTGGAGYIGSHTVLSLVEAGHEPVVADSYVNSKPTVLSRLARLAGREIPAHEIDLRDAAATADLFAAERFDAVIHFAALKAVGESVRRPLDYYRNNLDATFSLLEAMRTHGVDRFVFSSSATVYGEKAPVPYREDYDYLSSS